MSLNDQRRIKLERSGPWIGVAGLFVMVWFAFASSQFAPWWGVLLQFAVLVPAALLVARWARTRPTKAAFVPVGSLAVWIAITVIGVTAFDWKADPEPVSGAAGVVIAQCRAKFDDLHQTQSENGNPGQPGRTLTKDWDARYAEAARLAKKAKIGDCPKKFNALKDRLGGIETLIYGANPFDMVYALHGAERDLKHAEATRDYNPLPDKLRRAFQDLRQDAPRANAALGTELTAVDSADPTDGTAGKSALAALKKAAGSSAEFAACQRSLRIIGDYELDEE